MFRFSGSLEIGFKVGQTMTEIEPILPEIVEGRLDYDTQEKGPFFS